ncbi:hypothetical protein C8R31_102326 [Nitrosospira sp. Nsp2]|nr:hypothetical protein C8R31_102326 [Nitrosospira sp. Nsp2]
MLIRNNKQLKYRDGGPALECDILPRDNLSHPRGLVVETSTTFTTNIDNHAPRFALYYFNHTYFCASGRICELRLRSEGSHIGDMR